MRHFAVTLIVVALITCDFLAGLPSLHISTHDRHEWATADTVALLCAFFWFLFRGGDE